MSKTVNDKKLKYMEFINRENEDMHHSDDEDAYQYKLMAMGDPRAIEETRRIMDSGLPGRISENPLRNEKYLFVAAAALASRAAIHGGMESERSYNISDLYILKMDLLTTVEEVRALHIEMISFYTEEMAKQEKRKTVSKAINDCIDYIYEHLHERIKVDSLAEKVSLNSSYLSTLFMREMGVSISEYILKKKIEVAENMLLYSDYSCTEISEILSFSSQSHFIRTFKKYYDMTPYQFCLYHTRH